MVGGLWCKFRFLGFSSQVTPLISLDYFVAVYAQKRTLHQSHSINPAPIMLDRKGLGNVATEPF
jgi:hypothetical protein